MVGDQNLQKWWVAVGNQPVVTQLTTGGGGGCKSVKIKKIWTYIDKTSTKYVLNFAKFTGHPWHPQLFCGCPLVTIFYFVGDFFGFLNLVGDRSPMTPMDS
jgi:hypothetical protein